MNRNIPTPAGVGIFPLGIMFRLTLRPIQSPTQTLLVTFTLEVKHRHHDANHLAVSGVKV